MKAEGEIVGKIELNSDGEKVIQVEKINFKNMSIGDMNLLIRGLFDGNALLSKKYLKTHQLKSFHFQISSLIYKFFKLFKGSVVHYVPKRYAPQVFEVARPEVEEFVANYITHDILNPILKKRPYILSIYIYTIFSLDFRKGFKNVLRLT